MAPLPLRTTSLKNRMLMVVASLVSWVLCLSLKTLPKVWWNTWNRRPDRNLIIIHQVQEKSRQHMFIQSACIADLFCQSRYESSVSPWNQSTRFFLLSICLLQPVGSSIVKLWNTAIIFVIQNCSHGRSALHLDQNMNTGQSNCTASCFLRGSFFLLFSPVVLGTNHSFNYVEKQ